MRAKIQRPPVGTKMYFVRENYYYVPGDPAPKMEYCVCEGKIKEFLIGERVFYTAKEAAFLAKKKTEKYESIWGWMMDGSMRRTWEKYLEED